MFCRVLWAFFGGKLEKTKKGFFLQHAVSKLFLWGGVDLYVCMYVCMYIYIYLFIYSCVFCLGVGFGRFGVRWGPSSPNPSFGGFVFWGVGVFFAFCCFFVVSTKMPISCSFTGFWSFFLPNTPLLKRLIVIIFIIFLFLFLVYPHLFSSLSNFHLLSSLSLCLKIII